MQASGTTEIQTRDAAKSSGDKLAGVTSLQSLAAMSLAQKIWVLPWRAAGLIFSARKA